jgi:hypothetical protein
MATVPRHVLRSAKVNIPGLTEPFVISRMFFLGRDFLTLGYTSLCSSARLEYAGISQGVSAMIKKGEETRDTDLGLLKRLKGLAWLSNLELGGLVNGLATNNFKRHEVMLGENGLVSEAHILLAGVAKISCLNAKGERITVALVPPGPIPELPTQLPSRWRFQCDAYSNCRFGTLSWDLFNAIAVSAPPSAFREFHQNNLRLWYRLLLRGSTFLNLSLHERLEMALLELCQDFGIEESRGTLLRVAFSHKDLASLVGASRPRVSEHLAQLEREHVVFRQGRQLVVCARDLGNLRSLQAA